MKQLLDSLQTGQYDRCLRTLYGHADTARALHIVRAFGAHFPENPGPAALFSAPGRTEIGGNHTDHQHGHALCASVDLDMLACAAPNGLDEVRVISEGYPAVTVRLDTLSPQPEERESTAALVRGVAAGLQELGLTLRGVDAYVHSNVIAGSGLSSSAAFEVLLCTMLGQFAEGPAPDAIEAAKISQRAENVYFGKPCGLLDQIGSSVGGVVAIDFADPSAPAVRRVDFDLSAYGHSLCILDSGSTHADLTDDYASIPSEMKQIAAQFGQPVLRQLPEADFRSQIPTLRERCGDRAVLRALHYYQDDRLAQQEAAALEAGDFGSFLRLVNQSGLSSVERLQNIFSPAHPERQAVSLAITLGRELLAGSGAIRVHGGGFAGTVQAFVPDEKLEDFRRGIEAVFGPGKCHVLRIRPVGGCRLEAN